MNNQPMYVLGSGHYFEHADGWKMTAQPLRNPNPLDVGIGLKPIGWRVPPHAANDRKIA